MNQKPSPNDPIMMPYRLTAENGAKAALSGEFHVQVAVPNLDYCGCDAEDCDACNSDTEQYGVMDVPVSWTLIKQIYTAAVDLLGQTSSMVSQQIAGMLRSAGIPAMDPGSIPPALREAMRQQGLDPDQAIPVGFAMSPGQGNPVGEAQAWAPKSDEQPDPREPAAPHNQPKVEATREALLERVKVLDARLKIANETVQRQGQNIRDQNAALAKKAEEIADLTLRQRRIAEIIELGDRRLQAADGPCGGLPPDLMLDEWRELYRAAVGDLGVSMDAQDNEFQEAVNARIEERRLAYAAMIKILESSERMEHPADADLARAKEWLGIE
jgi:hypothetical protein